MMTGKVAKKTRAPGAGRPALFGKTSELRVCVPVSIEAHAKMRGRAWVIAALNAVIECEKISENISK